MKKSANPVIHFEIGCRDKSVTRDFYSSVFGWEITESGPSMDINTLSEIGINGHITSLGHEPHNYVNIYIEVDDIRAYLEDVEQKGGKKVVGPVMLQSGDEFAWFTDPDGNIIGLITNNE